MQCGSINMSRYFIRQKVMQTVVVPETHVLVWRESDQSQYAGSSITLEKSRVIRPFVSPSVLFLSQEQPRDSTGHWDMTIGRLTSIMAGLLTLRGVLSSSRAMSDDRQRIRVAGLGNFRHRANLASASLTLRLAFTHCSPLCLLCDSYPMHHK